MPKHNLCNYQRLWFLQAFDSLSLRPHGLHGRGTAVLVNESCFEKGCPNRAWGCKDNVHVLVFLNWVGISIRFVIPTKNSAVCNPNLPDHWKVFLVQGLESHACMCKYPACCGLCFRKFVGHVLLFFDGQEHIRCTAQRLQIFIFQIWWNLILVKTLIRGPASKANFWSNTSSPRKSPKATSLDSFPRCASFCQA